jgi:hypothetical protein
MEEGEKYTEIIISAAKECGIKHGDTTRAFALGFDYALMHGDWRSIKDELPNEDVLADVIVAVGDEIFHEYELAYFNKDKGQWFTVDGEAVNVVNWMPLPQLPTL